MNSDDPIPGLEKRNLEASYNGPPPPQCLSMKRENVTESITGQPPQNVAKPSPPPPPPPKKD